MKATEFKPRTGRVAAAVLVAILATGALHGCGKDDPPAEKQALQPEVPSDYMDTVVTTYNLKGASGELRWKPVRAKGRLWTGDPRVYEKVCGATFLNEDGEVPDLSAGVDGSKDADVSWYQWLQKHPEKWAAFNAWLKDPAVEAYASPSADNFDAGLGHHERRTGDSSGCEDAEKAGKPVG